MLLEHKREACKIKLQPFFLFSLDFDLFSLFCCVGVDTELGYLSPGEYEIHVQVQGTTTRFPMSQNYSHVDWRLKKIQITDKEIF